MATLTVKNLNGADAGTVEVSDVVFAAEPNKHAVRQAYLAYAANQRQGTHATKTRGQVSGGGRKPFKQKGTGRARQGSIRAPHYRGGAIIFGPQPRFYNQKVNRKVKSLALYSALSDLRNQNRIIVLESLDLPAPKTKEFVSLLARLGIADARKVVVLTGESNENLSLAARNVPNTMVLPLNNINVFELLTCDYIVTTSKSVKMLEDLLS
jgi:large subunit ribosomal protein L4